MSFNYCYLLLMSKFIPLTVPNSVVHQGASSLAEELLIMPYGPRRDVGLLENKALITCWN